MKHRTLVLVELIGDTPWDGDLGDLSRAVVYGDYSGTVLMEATTEVTDAHAGHILIAQGSDPRFLGLDDPDENGGVAEDSPPPATVVSVTPAHSRDADEQQLYRDLVRLCQDHGFTTEHTYDLLQAVIESINTDGEDLP